MVVNRIYSSLIALILVLLLFCTGLAVESVKIVPIGDSITQGTLQNDDRLDHPTYRYWLWKRLQEGGYDVDFVGSSNQPHLPFDFDMDHEGHDGYRTRDLLVNDRLKNWLSRYSPDIALVQLGTNDAMDGVPVETTISNLGRIIDILRERNPDIVILMGTIIPRGGHNENLPALNHAMVDLADRRSTATSPVVAVDQFSGYDGYDDNQPTRYLHPNRQGEQKIADRYYAALVPYLSGDRKGVATMKPTDVPTTVVTTVSEQTGTQQTIPEPPLNPESQTTTSPSPVSVTVKATGPIETVQTQTPTPDAVSVTMGSEAWGPSWGSSKQYLIGDQEVFPSPASTGWQSGSTVFGSTGLGSWKNENQYRQSSEPPAECFIRWYPERERGSKFC
jgi:lysophospholipase L1-like esterase